MRDYDEAAAWFAAALDFRVVEDQRTGDKRWLVIEAPNGGRLLLARAADEAQRALVGAQFAGRVGLFVEVADFAAAAARLAAAGAAFEAPPRDETYGRVAVFRDLYGNRWDMIQPA